MDMELTEEQLMLQKAARQFLTDNCPTTVVRKLEKDELGYSREMWGQMGEMGWLSLPLPERYGGMGGNNVDLVVLNKELGRFLCPSPFISTVIIAGTAIQLAGTEEQRRSYLGRIAEGKLVIAFALSDGGENYDATGVTTTAKEQDGNFVLSGTKSFVEWGRGSDELLVVARTDRGSSPEDGLSMFLVDSKSPGITFRPLSTLARDKQWKVVLDNVKVPRARMLGERGKAWSALDKAIQRGIVVFCAQMVGSSERVHEIAVEYAKMRIQFGRPIGTFQAIQHYLAMCYTEITGADTVTYYSAWALDEGELTKELVGITKSFVSDTYRQAGFIGAQIFGGLGGIDDTDVTLYFRRGKQAQLMMGGSDAYKDMVAAEVLDK